jgi:hypothetical protein
MIIPSLGNKPKEAEKIELNHVYSADTQRYNLSQILIRRRMVLPDSVGYRVVRYYCVPKDSVRIYPHKNGKVICFYDNNGEYHRYLTSNYLEYDSNYDAEVKDRKFLHEDDRQE